MTVTRDWVDAEEIGVNDKARPAERVGIVLFTRIYAVGGQGGSDPSSPLRGRPGLSMPFRGRPELSSTPIRGEERP